MVECQHKEKLLSAKEVAEYLRLSVVTTRSLLRQRAIKGFKAGREWRVSQDGLQEYMLKNPTRR